jgi:hypothetical protein
MCLTVDEEMRPSASELLENSMFNSLSRKFQALKGGEVDMVDPIHCPKVLRFLNSRLPKAKKDDEFNSKRNVTFINTEDVN